MSTDLFISETILPNIPSTLLQTQRKSVIILHPDKCDEGDEEESFLSPFYVVIKVRKGPPTDDFECLFRLFSYNGTLIMEIRDNRLNDAMKKCLEDLSDYKLCAGLRNLAELQGLHDVKIESFRTETFVRSSYCCYLPEKGAELCQNCSDLLRKRSKSRKTKQIGAEACPKCGKSGFASFRGFERHIRICGGGVSRFSCNKFCDSVFVTGNDYLEHLNQCSKSDTKCAKSSIVFDSLKTLDSPLKTYGKSRSCPKCNQIFIDGYGLEDHLIACQKSAVNMVCFICFEDICAENEESHLSSHERSLHLTSRVYCPTCYEEIEPLRELNHHHLRVHGNVACLKCFKTFDQDEIGQHWALNHVYYNFECPKCSKHFKSTSALQIHMEVVHRLK